MSARKGVAHHKAKLTEQDVKDARAAYAAGGVSYLTLACRFGVNACTLRDAVLGKTWRHLP